MTQHKIVYSTPSSSPSWTAPADVYFVTLEGTGGGGGGGKGYSGSLSNADWAAGGGGGGGAILSSITVSVVSDATIEGSETGTSFRQALYFMQCGFKLLDTMIYQVAGTGAKGSNLAYWQEFEYMFVFTKGIPKSVNRLRDKENIKSGVSINKVIGGRSPKYGNKQETRYQIEKHGYRTNVWRIHPSNGNDQTEHPAPFPEALAHDHILSWSNEGDTVLDCFAGSGTTLKKAKELSRHYIGIERVPKYVKISEKRLLATSVPLFGLGRGLTPREPDKRDSSPSQAFSQPEFLSDLEGLS